MCHDDPVDVTSAEMLHQPPPQRPHPVDRHVRTGECPPIVDFEIRNAVDAGRQIQDLTTAQRRNRSTGRCIVSHRYRTAGEDDDDHPARTLPPFTFRISPVMWRAISEQRKRMGPAMSRGAATRPIGMPRAIASFPCPAKGFSHISVSTQPGATLFTVMPRGANSMHNDFT